MSAKVKRRSYLDQFTHELFSYSSTSFRDLVETSEFFFDKTELIKTFFDYSAVLVLAPGRFGKTANIDMLKTFLEIQVDENGNPLPIKDTCNYRLFTNKRRPLKIVNHTKFMSEHFGQHPVIYVKLFSADIPITTEDDIMKMMRAILQESFMEHYYLTKSKNIGTDDKKTFLKYCNLPPEFQLRLVSGISFLAEVLFKHHKKKVFVLVDEYDTLLRRALFVSRLNITNTVATHCALLGHVMKVTSYIEGGFLTGTSFVITDDSDFENVHVFNFLRNHDFSKYYGINETEMTDLLNKLDLDEGIVESMNNWYNGYLIQENYGKIYPFESISKFLNKYLDTSIPKFMTHWKVIGFMKNAKDVYKVPNIKNVLMKLVANDSFSVLLVDRIHVNDLEELQSLLMDSHNTYEYINASLLFSFLFDLGYLTFEKSEHKHGPAFRLRIPNVEIKEFFINSLYEYYTDVCHFDKELIDEAINKLNLMSETLNSTAIIQFFLSFQNLLEPIKSHNYLSDEFVCTLLLFLGLQSNFFVKPKMPKECNADDLIVMQHEHTGIMINMKVNVDVETTFENIINNKYIDLFYKFDYLFSPSVTSTLVLAVSVSRKAIVHVQYSEDGEKCINLL